MLMTFVLISVFIIEKTKRIVKWKATLIFFITGVIATIVNIIWLFEYKVKISTLPFIILIISTIILFLASIEEYMESTIKNSSNK